MASSASKRLRLSISVTQLMSIALDSLAARNGVQPATQATMLLRQALDRTMESKEVQQRYAAHLRQRTTAQWREDQTTDHAIETQYAKEAQADRGGPTGTATHK